MSEWGIYGEQRMGLRQRIVAMMICSGMAANVWAADDARVISLDYCADQYVLRLAAPRQIVALSRDATAAHSLMRDQAASFARHAGNLEDIVLRPATLLITAFGGGPRLDSLAPKAGRRVFRLGYDIGEAALLERDRRLAAALGQSARAEVLASERKRKADWLRAAPALSMRAAYLTPSGVTAGAGTSVDKLLRLAGLVNYAGDRQGWGSLSLEHMVARPPDLFVLAFFDKDTGLLSNWGVARHPLLRRMLTDIPTVTLDAGYLGCGDLYQVDAAYALRRRINQQKAAL